MALLPEAAYWLALTYASGLKLTRVKAIVTDWCLEEAQPLAALFELSSEEMATQVGLSAEEREQIISAAGRVPEQVAWLGRLEGDNIQLITRADTRYPPALVRGLPPTLQPLLLFCQGNIGLLDRPAAAVIGAQEAGRETVSLARELATLLAEEGLAVVSGLGKGVGQAAFGGALSAEGGQAIAVLPMGIHTLPGMPDVAVEVKPAVEQGQVVLVSPFHPEARFSEAQAVARNKLVVGLAEAVFVLAAGEGGMARDTANEALRLGKAVYVWDVDPAVEPAAAGNQALIQDGALPIAGVSETLEAVEAILAAALELTDAADTPSPSPPPLVTGLQSEEAETPYDPQAALDLLAGAGRVPEVLARKLRGAGAGEEHP
jgi:DNA processing protein